MSRQLKVPFDFVITNAQNVSATLYSNLTCALLQTASVHCTALLLFLIGVGDG
jgi:hypothetical protein